MAELEKSRVNVWVSGVAPGRGRVELEAQVMLPPSQLVIKYFLKFINEIISAIDRTV